jgi:DNA-binding CsgD family transcriptional regulator
MKLCGRSTPESGPIYIVRPNGRPLVAEVVSIRDLVTLISQRAYAILLISDSAEPYLTRRDELGRTFGMTAAEILMCEKLLNGLSLSEAGGELGIAIGTARQRLKSIFQKTDTHRQGELLLLLSKLSSQNS